MGLVLRALMHSDHLRRLVVDAMLAEIRLRSAQLAQLHQSSKSQNTPMIYDALVIGGTGPAGTQLATVWESQRRTEGRAPNYIVVERDESVGGVFDSILFNLNTANKAGPNGFDLPRFRKENDNQILGAELQVSHFDRAAYPLARSVSDLIKVLLAKERSPILLGYQVTKVELEADQSLSQGKRIYRVTAKSMKEDQLEIQLYTNAVINADGLGVPNVPGNDKETKNYVESEFAAFAKNPAYEGHVLNFGIVSRRIDAMNNPMAPYVNKTVLVVGDSVASRDFILWLMRYGPTESYKESPATDGRPKKIYWIGPNPQDFAEFMKNNRTYYARIASAIKNSTLELVGGGRLKSVIPQKSESGETKSVIVMTDKHMSSTSGSMWTGEAVVGDVVFLGIGYQNKSEEIFQDLVNKGELVDSTGKPVRLILSKAVEMIAAPANLVINAQDATAGPVAIARQLKGHAIYFIGAGAGLVADNDKPGSTRGSPLLVDNMPRVAEFARKFSNGSAWGGSTPFAGNIQIHNVGVTSLKRRYPLADISLGLPSNALYLKARTLAAFESAKSKVNLSHFALEFTFSKCQSDGICLNVNTKSRNKKGQSIAKRAINELKKMMLNHLATDHQFIEYLFARIGDESESVLTVETNNEEDLDSQTRASSKNSIKDSELRSDPFVNSFPQRKEKTISKLSAAQLGEFFSQSEDWIPLPWEDLEKNRLRLKGRVIAVRENNSTWKTGILECFEMSTDRQTNYADIVITLRDGKNRNIVRTSFLDWHPIVVKLQIFLKKKRRPKI